MVSMQFILLLAGLALACFTPNGLAILLFIALGMLLWGFWTHDPRKKLMGGALALAGLIVVPLIQGLTGSTAPTSSGPTGPIAMAQPPPVIDPAAASFAAPQGGGATAVPAAPAAPLAAPGAAGGGEQPVARPAAPGANAPAGPARRVGNSTDLSREGIPVMPPPAKAPHGP